MYDRREVFKKHIQKKAEEINELCKSLGIVSFMSFAVKDDEKETVPPGDDTDSDDYMSDIDDYD